jgi:hypothetical protein
LENKKFILEEIDQKNVAILKDFHSKYGKTNEKMRSVSANIHKSPLNSQKIDNNVLIISQQKASNTAFLRNSNEKGFYDSIDKTKKKTIPNLGIKFGSINLQDENK